eukprot:ANDGO_00939.mRNA.1 Tubulin-folding cofactor C
MTDRESQVRERLADRQQALQEAHNARVEQLHDESAPEENTEEFVTLFRMRCKSLSEQLDSSSSSSSSASSRSAPSDEEAFKAYTSTLQELQAQLNAHARFLPAYELRRGQEQITELSSRVAKLRKETGAPKKKFSLLGARVKTGPPPAPAASLAENGSAKRKDLELMAEGASIQKIEDLVALEAEGPRPCHTFSEGFLGKTVSIAKCRGVRIEIPVSVGAVTVSECDDCEIVMGPVDSSLFVDKCHSCIIVIACHQARIHSSSKCSLYLHCGSNPIIEDCSEMGFAPYAAQYSLLEEQMKACGFSKDRNRWDMVDDFKWLMSERSPHWFVIPEPCRRSPDDFFIQHS